MFDAKALNEPGLPREVAVVDRLLGSMRVPAPHPWLTPYLLLVPGLGVARDLLRRPARVPRLPVARVRLVRARLHVQLGVAELLRTRSRRTTSSSSARSSTPGSRRLSRSCQLPARVLDRVPRRALEEPRLLLIIAPFFVTYLIRTLAWQTILADNGRRRERCATSRARTTAACSPRRPRSSRGSPTTSCPSWRCPCTSSLEQIDPRLIEAAQDLYASRVKAFLRVTLPLSLPGVSRGRCSPSSRRPVTSSTRSCSARRSST